MSKQHYSMLIEWSSVDQVYVVTLPEWEEWARESDDLLPADITPVIAGQTYTEAAARGEQAIEMLLGFCILDGHTAPSPHATFKSPQLKERYIAKGKEERQQYRAALFGYNPDSGLDLNAWIFAVTMAESKIRDEGIQGEDAAILTHRDIQREVRGAVERIRQPMPEDMPTGPSIRKLVEERRRAAKKREVQAQEHEGQPQLFGQDEDQA